MVGSDQQQMMDQHADSMAGSTWAQGQPGSSANFGKPPTFCRSACGTEPLCHLDTVSPWMCPTQGRGGSFCDDPVVFDRSTRHHDSGISSPNHVMEEPAVLAEIGDPIGL
jgi:hypothetical protein